MSEASFTASFHKSLYDAAAVKEAAVEFEGYATVAVEESDTETTVTLSGYDARYGDLFGDTFCNNALFKSIVRSREVLGGGAA
ncbi:MAG: HxsD-like protein [Myxococcota bacterium]